MSWSCSPEVVYVLNHRSSCFSSDRRTRTWYGPDLPKERFVVDNGFVCFTSEQSGTEGSDAIISEEFFVVEDRSIFLSWKKRAGLYDLVLFFPKGFSRSVIQDASCRTRKKECADLGIVVTLLCACTRNDRNGELIMIMLSWSSWNLESLVSGPTYRLKVLRVWCVD